MTASSGELEAHKFSSPPRPLPRPAANEYYHLGMDAQVARIYFRAGRHPTTWNQFRYFGPTSARFDHHLPDSQGAPRISQRGIIYGAEILLTCCAEVFQLSRMIDRAGGAPWLVIFSPARPLRLLNVAGFWATRAKTSTLLNNGPKGLCRAWAQEIYRSFPHLDGIAYASSMAGHAPAFALFERAGDALPMHPLFNQSLDHPGLEAPLYNVAYRIGYNVI
ncbi:MAG TPA: RES family NAD+ phosphorylase [Kiloniellales bacterium]|nr:RES family NAD+ phosphorylase [Kiloniellales bacterium]